MGESKKRGSFEQRQQAAYDRIDATRIPDAELDMMLAHSEAIRKMAEQILTGTRSSGEVGGEFAICQNPRDSGKSTMDSIIAHRNRIS